MKYANAEFLVPLSDAREKKERKIDQSSCRCVFFSRPLPITTAYTIVFWGFVVTPACLGAPFMVSLPAGSAMTGLIGAVWVLMVLRLIVAIIMRRLTWFMSFIYGVSFCAILIDIPWILRWLDSPSWLPPLIHNWLSPR